jgi:hypothetical protein
MTRFTVYVRKEDNVAVKNIGNGNSYTNEATTNADGSEKAFYQTCSGDKYTIRINLSNYFAASTLDISSLQPGKYEVGVAASTVYDPDSSMGSNIEWGGEDATFTYSY